MKKVYDKILITVLFLSFFFAACTADVKAAAGDGGNNNDQNYVIDETKTANEIPLTILAEAAGTITLRRTDLVTNLKYTINDGTPIDVCSADPVNIDIAEGDKVRFFGKGTNNDYGNYFNIRCSSDCSVYGNVMSLLISEYQTFKTITKEKALAWLFSENKHLKNHQLQELVLPATTLTSYCYYCMFSDCTSLKSAPELAATNLADSCYCGMFSDCTSLKSAPELAATNLADCCYWGMFLGCTSLVEAPKLPATTLTVSCYRQMFSDCTALEEAPELPSTSLANSCYDSMFSGCTALKEAPELPSTSLANRCYYSMFSGCTALKDAPGLPATTLTDFCYGEMFNGCALLKYIECLAKDILADRCTLGWLSGVAPEGIFVTPEATSWMTSESGIPNGWTRIKNDTASAREIPLTLLAETDGKIVLRRSSYFTNLRYTKNDENFISVNSENDIEINVLKGDKVRLFAEGSNNPESQSGLSFNITLQGRTCCSVYGNIMSLLSAEFQTATEITSSYAFHGLFKDCEAIQINRTKELVLPATKLTAHCYDSMFYGTLISRAPELPATTLAEGCYYSMFYDCDNLTKTPELPATTLAKECYSSMFFGCRLLKEASVLPARTLEEGCYDRMFACCLSLKEAPVLPATILSTRCYFAMFAYCPLLTKAPELPAQTLAVECYKAMFSDCDSLRFIKCMASDISATDCTKEWVDFVSPEGVFETLESTQWSIGKSGIPEGWTRVNTQ